jgi:hypothetical protein
MPSADLRQGECLWEDIPAPGLETDIRIRWIDDFIHDWQAEAFGQWLQEHGA